MTDYRDRQIELFLQEELGGQTPPDQLQSILDAAQERLDVCLSDASPESDGSVVTNSSIDDSHLLDTPRNSQSKLAMNLQRAVSSRLWPWEAKPAFAWSSLAALILIGVGLLFYSLQWYSDSLHGVTSQQRDPTRQSSPLTQAGLVARDGIVMPLATDAEFETNEPRLRDGWVMTQPAMEQLHIGFNEVAFHDARAVVRVGHVPDSYEVVYLARQLQQSNYLQSQEEFEMLINSRKWVALMGFAICMLSGEAIVGQDTLIAQKSDTDITVDQVFDRFDLNDDEKLSMDECVCQCSKKCDLNSDEQVTRKEFHQAVAKFAGSENRYVELVVQHGGVEKFYQLAKSGRFDKVANVSMDSVFAYLDQDGSGVLEKRECICPGSKMADADGNDEVTKAELTAVAVGHFGSEDQFLAVVREAGGVKNFYKKVLQKEKRSKTTIGQVFNQFDRDMSGELEASEMIFPNATKADSDGSNSISMTELKRLARKAFGSVGKFEDHVNEFGGAKKFYEAIKSGKIGPPATR